MGRTYTNRREDDWESNRKKANSSKHSRNVPGQGMRIINSLSDEDDYDDFDDDLDYEYDDNTTLTQRK